MKIAIITLAGYANNGNRLQNYALQQTLLKLFPNSQVDTVTIDEAQGFIKKGIKLSKEILKRVLNYNYKKHQNFKIFNKNINFTKQSFSVNNDLSSIVNEYDFFVTGSDQVWNLGYLKNEKFYFLKFAPSEKKLSYAASVGNNNLSPKKQAIFKTLLKDFNIISVREKQSEEMLRKLGFENVITSIDPTFLLTKEEWAKVSTKPKYNFTKDYIFVCLLGKVTEEYQNAINSIAEKHNLEIIDINDMKNSKIYNCGPSHFINLIDNAKLVVTDSFHSIVFSIIHKTPFLHFNRKDGGANANINSRIQNLERIFKTTFPTEKELESENLFEFKINNSEQIIEEERQNSYEYLKSATEPRKNINLDDKKFKCTGCGMCASVCPTKAISIVKNKKGFYCYEIDKTKCVNCGLCLKMCPANKKYQPIQFDKTKIYGAKNSQVINDNSSSAGVFGKLATNILNKNGVVYGLSYNSENTFMRVTDIKSLEQIKGSKYYQSNLSTSYPQIEEDLKNNKTVLVCGTPCQIAGLKQKFFSFKNLITVGVVCHGTPSKDTFNKFCLEKYVELPLFVNFRKKNPYWENYDLEFHFKDKIIIEQKPNVSWFRHFLKNTFLNNCCYNCNFAGKEYGADLILGDFWGIKNIDKKFHDPFGTSICLCLTEKGQDLFSQIKENLITKEYKNMNKIIPHNPCIAKTNYGVNSEYNQELFYINDQNGLAFEENIKEIEKVTPVVKRSFVKKVLRKIKNIILRR